MYLVVFENLNVSHERIYVCQVYISRANLPLVSYQGLDKKVDYSTDYANTSRVMCEISDYTN